MANATLPDQPMSVARLAAPVGVRPDTIRYYERAGLLPAASPLLAVRDTGSCPREPAEQLLRSRIAEVDAELARLGALRVDLVRMADALPDADCPDPVPGRWCPPGTERR